MTDTTIVSNSAQMAVHLSQDNHAIPEIIATGIDADAKHFYMNERGGPAVNAIQRKKGRYIGTRFTDGSAIAVAGHLSNPFPVEFLGTFHGEQVDTDERGYFERVEDEGYSPDEQ